MVKERVLLIDNDDSFTYNIASILAQNPNQGIERSYKIISYSAFKIEQLHDYSHILISPGPMTPNDYPKHREIIAHSTITHKPLLGICLGHQSIGVYFGAKLQKLKNIAHGLCSKVFINNKLNNPLWNKLTWNLPESIDVGRYHSWELIASSINIPLQITSIADDDTVMAISHESLPIFGIQFHPESFLSPQGATLIQNFLDLPYKPQT